MLIRRITTSRRQLSTEEIFDEKLFRVVVAGNPRSGTSMMSGICSRLGVDWLSNSDTDQLKRNREIMDTEEFGGIDYQMNEDFYELIEDRARQELQFIATPGSGLKIILPLAPYTQALLGMNPVRVIQMWRDPVEIRMSHEKSYRNGEPFPEKVALKLQSNFQRNLEIAEATWHKLGIPSLHLMFSRVISDPEGSVRQVAEFINSSADQQEALDWVKPDKYRNKSTPN